MDIQIEGRQIDLRSEWRAEIEGRFKELQAGHDDLTRARATLIGTCHKNTDEVAEALLVASMPGRRITARKQHETFEHGFETRFLRSSVSRKNTVRSGPHMKFVYRPFRCVA